MNFLYFNIIWSVIIDYMHGACLGVAKKLLHLWFDSENSGNAWYLGKKISLVDKLLCKIRPPSTFTRLPRSINDHGKHWKAAEFRSWILFYSPIVLRGILPDDLYYHWLLFVSALMILLQKSISFQDLEQAHSNFSTFYYSFEKFYDVKFCSMNIHISIP
eukprot:Pompholyxophrys_punicea_v1_NODE_953_length_1102_cov_5.841452.p1 type:complete len:160 gc:universal NODE_953_length_1102_cov_5.841452:202-681(+)